MDSPASQPSPSPPSGQSVSPSSNHTTVIAVVITVIVTSLVIGVGCFIHKKLKGKMKTKKMASPASATYVNPLLDTSIRSHFWKHPLGFANSANGNSVMKQNGSLVGPGASKQGRAPERDKHAFHSMPSENAPLTISKPNHSAIDGPLHKEGEHLNLQESQLELGSLDRLGPLGYRASLMPPSNGALQKPVEGVPPCLTQIAPMAPLHSSHGSEESARFSDISFDEDFDLSFENLGPGSLEDQLHNIALEQEKAGSLDHHIEILPEVYGADPLLMPTRHSLTEHRKSINNAKLLAETFGPPPVSIASLSATIASSIQAAQKSSTPLSSAFNFTQQRVPPLPLPPALESAAILKQKTAPPAIEAQPSVLVKSVAAAFAQKSSEVDTASPALPLQGPFSSVPVKSVAAVFANQASHIEIPSSYSAANIQPSVPVKIAASTFDNTQTSQEEVTGLPSVSSIKQPTFPGEYVSEMAKFYSSTAPGTSLAQASMPLGVQLVDEAQPNLVPAAVAGMPPSSPSTANSIPSALLLSTNDPLSNSKAPSPPPPPPPPPPFPNTKGPHPSPPLPPPLVGTKAAPSPPPPSTKVPAPPPPPLPATKALFQSSPSTGPDTESPLLPLPPTLPAAKGSPVPPLPASVPNTKGPHPPPPPNGKGPPLPPAPPGPPVPKAPPPPPSSAPQAPVPAKPPQVPPQESAQNLQKLKPLHWDKVRADPSHSMVWDRVRTGSFELNEDEIAALFGTKPSVNKEIGKVPATKKKGILDAKKAQDIAIQLRALKVSTQDICDALLEGSGMKADLLDVLVKMIPTQEEQKALLEFSGDRSELGPAERFLKSILEIPNAVPRLQAMQFRSCFKDDLSSALELVKVLEAACVEVRDNRLFLKLLEAVLKTGNRLNKGTNRGEAEAFKLDTLLRLSDVKGGDGKTTLLQFVAEEIIKSEGLKALRGGNPSTQNSSEPEVQLKESEVKHKGLEVVWQLCTELRSVKDAAGVDADELNQSVMKLANGLLSIQNWLKTIFQEQAQSLGIFTTEDTFSANMEAFCLQAENDVTKLKEEVAKVFDRVKKVTAYFHGTTREAQPLRLFIIVRDFLGMLEKVCRDLGRPLKMNLRG